MRKRTVQFVLFATAWLAQSLWAADRVVKVDPMQVFQTMDHFTASDAWSGALVGRYWAEPERKQIAEWLFSQELDASGDPKGIGLSLWRVNTGAGTWEQADCDIQPLQRRVESFKTIDGQHYDWGKCAGQRYFMEQAKAMGCNSFLLFSNSPLVQWTANGKGYADHKDRANIRPEGYVLYGDYLAEVATHYLQEGFRIRYISPINEPQVDWARPAQEGSSWRLGEMKRMYAALDAAMQQRASLDSVQILVGEASSIPVLYREDQGVSRQFKGDEETPHRVIQAFFEPQSPHYVGDLKHVPRLIGAHTYHNHATNQEIEEIRRPVKDTCAHYDVRYYQTEWCLLPYGEEQIRRFDGFTSDWKATTHTDMQVALLMGRLIYADIVCSGAEAWGYWKAMELNGNHALISLQAKEGNLLMGGHATPNKLLWALGNYSRFIRPGYQRVALEGAEELAALCGSAYRSPDGKRLVLVFVNTGFEREEVRLTLPKAMQKQVRKISLYRTDERTDLSLVESIEGASRPLSIAPRSLTTCVVEL